MEDKKRVTLMTSTTLHPGKEAGKPSTHQVDLLQEVPEPDAISLDNLLFQRPGDEDCFRKGEGPSCPDSNELDSVLDSLLDSSTQGHSHPWSDYVSSEIGDNQLIHVLSSSGKSKDIGAISNLSQGEVCSWIEAKVIRGSMSPNGKDRTTLQEANLNLPGKIVTATNIPLFPLELGFNTMSVLPLNQAYIAARARQILDVEGADQKPLSPSTTLQSSQHLVPFSNAQPTIKQNSLLHSENLEDAKIKKEDAEMSLYKPDNQVSVSPDYGVPPKLPASPDLANSFDYILYKSESKHSLDSIKAITQGKLCDSPGNIQPSTSSTPQPTYQPTNLNGHQHFGYQTATLKECFFPQIQLSYGQFIRSDSDADQRSPYGFESFPQKICLICGDEASGCHYGVLTCGSCKVFFKRAIEGQHNYLCAGRNDCIVDKIRRKNCPSCRLRKCCQAGMVLGGRKFKKFSRVKTGREIDTIVFQQTTSVPTECQQALTRRISTSPTQEIQFIPELLHILQSIEPEVVYAGYDNSRPETPSALLSSLNQLCERQLLSVVKWSKSLPGFRSLHIDDQITLLQYSWMSLMVFALGWRSYKHVSGQMLYFAPDLILNEQRMKESSFYSLCLAMWQLPQEFVKFQVSHEEFLCMKALLLLNTIPLEGLKSQNQFDEMRTNYIRELAKAIGLKQKGVVASSQRFYQLTKLMDSMHELVKQLHLYCLNTFLQSRALSVEFPEMMSEVISAQLPKILAGMVKPLVFHKK
ncbi:progesterone receptor [Bombina bombina]|uniref:progesterone receptor n=1 Tax=Bombina bombina TaxID=8345 RepID=UPI00235ABC66|nr:progesterone receptor [Bombina bombina]